MTAEKEKPLGFRDKIIHYGIFKLDFLFWMIPKYFESSSLSFFGVPPEVQANLTPEEKHWLSDVFFPSMNPISQRQAGMVNDRINSIFLDYKLDEITEPTMIVHARDDTLVNPTHSQYAAQKIPDAKVIALHNAFIKPFFAPARTLYDITQHFYNSWRTQTFAFVYFQIDVPYLNWVSV